MFIKILLVGSGLLIVSLGTILRKYIDPLFDDYPLLATLALGVVILTFTAAIMVISTNYAKPLPPRSKKKRPGDTPPPPISFFLEWGIIASILILMGIHFSASQATLAWGLWITGGTIFISILFFLMIPSTVPQQLPGGEVGTRQNILHLPPGAFAFWTTAIFTGGFFLVIGAFLKPYATVAAITSFGVGTGWCISALTFAILTGILLGGITVVQSGNNSKLVPEENFSTFQGNQDFKFSIMKAYSEFINHLGLFKAEYNGILLWGGTSAGRNIVVRSFAGESGRSLLEIKLSSFNLLEKHILKEQLQRFFRKIKTLQPALLHITDYEEVLGTSEGALPPPLESIREFLEKILHMKNTLVIATVSSLSNIPEDFRTPPIMRWVLEVPLPDPLSRSSILKRSLLTEAKKKEALSGDIALMSEEMIKGYDLKKLGEMMDGFSIEVIEEVVHNALNTARELKRSLRQLDLDVAIRKKKQGIQDPTIGPMEAIRAILTPEKIRLPLIEKAVELAIQNKRRSREPIIIVGPDPILRMQIIQLLAEKELFSFNALLHKELSRNSLAAMRNFIIQSRKKRPAILYVDPIELLFPRVQLSNFGYHGEIYNQKVIELTQVLQDKQYWFVGSTPQLSSVDPMILRKLTKVIDINELQRELISQIEEHALAQILDGVPLENVDLSQFFKEPVLTGEPPPKEIPEPDQPTSGPDNIQINLPQLPTTLIPGYMGRDEIQEEIISVLDSSRMKIRAGGSKLLGSFLFIGPKQTGKKTMAQSMAELLYKDPKSFIYRDMSLYEELYYSEQLIRKPVLERSAVNVPEGLWDLLKENPNQLLYLDNIERAHPSIWAPIEELLRTGALHWQKQELPLENLTIVMASTLFSPQDIEALDVEDRAGEVARIVQKNDRRLAYLPVFQTPFLSLLDRILPFVPYREQELRDVIDFEVNRILRSFLEGKKANMTISTDLGLVDGIYNQIEQKHPDFSKARTMTQNLMLPVLHKIDDKIVPGSPPQEIVLFWSGNKVDIIAHSYAQPTPEPASTV